MLYTVSVQFSSVTIYCIMLFIQFVSDSFVTTWTLAS